MEDFEKKLYELDFTANRKGLQERLWKNIVTRMKEASDDERELTEEELLYVTAAGNPHMMGGKGNDPTKR